MRAILLVSVVFDEVLASRHDETPIQGSRKAERGIFLDAHSTAGDLRQAGETNLWKKFLQVQPRNCESQVELPVNLIDWLTSLDPGI